MQERSYKSKRRTRPTGGNNKPAGSSRDKPTNSSRRPTGKFRSKQRPAKSGRKPSTLDPNLLVKKALTVEVKDYRSDRLIESLPLNPRLIECLLKKGFERPSEIQDRTLEALLDKRDLLGIAQTGTGKTGAFLIPIIEQLLNHGKKPFALVLVPTRELALQVEEEFRSMTKGLRLFSHVFIGGTSVNKDQQILRRPAHVVIATPGRLLDLVQRKALDLRQFNTLVLDEFDRMLDMGFAPDVKRIIHAMQRRKHTLLFSATMDKTQENLISGILTNPVRVKVSMGDTTADQIDQDIIRVKTGEDKFHLLRNLLADEEFSKVLLFEETKRRVSRLCDKLNRSGVKADQIHGDKSQNQRQNALKAFKQGRVRVLVATDVAARGIDVSDVTHVINYQVPQSYDSYIHRIGRTGRAGKTGKAFTFVGGK